MGLGLLVRILDTCITIASRFACSRALSDGHTRWARIHRCTQCPRITSICITREEAPAVRTRIGGGPSIYHTASVDTESISISANLGRVAGAWHGAV